MTSAAVAPLLAYAEALPERDRALFLRAIQQRLIWHALDVSRLAARRGLA